MNKKKPESFRGEVVEGEKVVRVPKKVMKKKKMLVKTLEKKHGVRIEAEQRINKPIMVDVNGEPKFFTRRQRRALIRRGLITKKK